MTTKGEGKRLLRVSRHGNGVPWWLGKPSGRRPQGDGPMSIMSNLDGGRVNQKLRTHLDLVECAAQFVREGKAFTVAEVADRAKVGRTTAYRYFPTVEALIAHASLHATTQVAKDSIDAALQSKTSAQY